ncbi:protein kinase domain-containing protein [Nocardia nova]|uniref:protein kinase domain-containing protein n=1 Tax=Nocardia nova TaxID=37330 RepID=UPI0027E3769E|nr:protein kinase [Nocardia nova]
MKVDEDSMGSSDLFATQSDEAATLKSELRAAGFDDPLEIGRGGFGAVYRCAQPALDRVVAVKVLTRGIDDENRTRFLREQRAMGRLTGHPNIVTVLQVGATQSGYPFLVMQYHPRESLDAVIRRSGPLSVPQVLRLGVKLAGAVETAHRLGVLHCDIKPGNILLTRYGEPALTDFGIAHFAGGFETAAGTVIASPAFTAPEVLKGERPSAASDVYSLAATLFSALTGHAAFERRTGERVVTQFVRITTDPVPDLRERGIPGGLADAIERAMAAEPVARPSTAAEFGETLRAIESDYGLVVDDMALPAEGGGARKEPGLPEPGPAPIGHGGAHSGRSTVGRLPSELTSFVGRKAELRAAREQLTKSRLVTLTGIGGVGKTRLALRLAGDVRKSYPDGVWLVELAELQDESLIADALASSLGLGNQSAAPMQDVVVEYLATRRALVVLDNCEHMIEAVARLARTLLRACPALRVLATSREPLDIEGEKVLRVPPLTVPDPGEEPALIGVSGYDAVTLFEERAATAVPRFEITDENLATVVRICRHLDGLPLAIELATARLRAMSVEQLSQRLTDRYKLLTHSNRVAPTRQQTLRLCVEWSYELCTAAEQLAWAQLSVFAGSSELDAVEAVCLAEDGAVDLLDCLASLVDKSILIREELDGVVRYRMLETLREFGREKAQAGGIYASLRRRHHEWYRQLVLEAEASWVGAEQLRWLARLGREQANLREAMEYALSDEEGADTESALRIAAGLFPFWLSRNLLSEGRYWLDRALSEGCVDSSAHRLKAMYADSVLAELQGELAFGGELVAEGQAIAAKVGHRVGVARMAHAAGLLALYSGDVAKACGYLEDALAVFTVDDDQATRVWILMMLGLAYDLDGRPERAIACQENVLEITDAAGESVYRSYSLWALGVTVFRQDDPERASELFRQCLRLCQVVDQPLVTAVCLEALAWVAAETSDMGDAALLMGAADALGAAVGSSAILFPELRNHHEKCWRLAWEALGESEFRGAYRRGSRMTADRAIALALAAGRSRTAVAGPMLTAMEREVGELVARGLSNDDIAGELAISLDAARRHLEQIRTKLGVRSKKEISVWIRAQRRGHGSTAQTAASTVR